MNTTEFVDAVTARLGDKRVSAAAVDAVVDIVQRATAKGEKVSIRGLGTFEKRDRAARKARNPRTGEEVKVRKTSVPAFRPGTELKAVAAGKKKLGREPKHVPLLPANLTSPRVLARVLNLLDGTPADSAPAARAQAPTPVRTRRSRATTEAAPATPAATPAAAEPTTKAAEAPATRRRRGTAADDTPAPKPARNRRATKGEKAEAAAIEAQIEAAADAQETSPQQPAAQPDTTPTPTSKEVRAWAATAGVTVPTRGPLSADIIEQYKAAQATPATQATAEQTTASAAEAKAAPKRRARRAETATPAVVEAPAVAAPTAPEAATAGEPDSKDVRAWAEKNGVTVSPRGRIAAAVVEQYKAAQAEATATPPAEAAVEAPEATTAPKRARGGRRNTATPAAEKAPTAPRRRRNSTVQAVLDSDTTATVTDTAIEITAETPAPARTRRAAAAKSGTTPRVQAPAGADPAPKRARRAAADPAAGLGAVPAPASRRRGRRAAEAVSA